MIPGVVDETEATLASNDNASGEEVNGSASRGRSARDVVTPLAHLSYPEQLDKKKNSLMQILKRLVSCLAFNFYLIYNYLVLLFSS